MEEKFIPLEAALKLVKKGGYAYHTQSISAYPLIEKTFSNKEVCELNEVHLTKPHYEGIAVGKNITFLEMVRVG